MGEEVQLLLECPRPMEAACKKLASKRCQQCSCVHRGTGGQGTAEAGGVWVWQGPGF